MVWVFILALVVGLVPAMADNWFTYQFTGTVASQNQINVSGVLDAVSNGDGTFTAVSGSGILDVNGITYGLALYPNPIAPGVCSNCGGLGFDIDNQLLPAGDPMLTSWGLLFAFTGSSPNSSVALNIWGNAPSSPYTSYLQFSGIQQDGSFTLTSVPEPGAVSMLVSMLAGLAGLAGVLKRRLR
jgi:hypothetical protein